MKVGWIGLGQIGTAMALEVLAAGHEVIGHTRRETGRDELREAGAKLTGSLAETANGTDVLIVSVFDDSQVREVLLGPVGALATMKAGGVVAIHTTGSPKLARELADAAPDGVAVIDATFSGAATQIGGEGLTIMVGGDRDALERARPVLSTYGGSIVHVGAVGDAQKLKLINNVLFAGNVLLAAEAVRIAENNEFDSGLMVSTLTKSSGSSFALNLFAGGRPVESVIDGLRRYLDKDVAIARNAAADAGIDLGILGELTATFGAAQESPTS
jgi:3-hydroxyisobutyrate dehydrogenase-like beta-hydroxyacid dehydrogenase